MTTTTLDKPIVPSTPEAERDDTGVTEDFHLSPTELGPAWEDLDRKTSWRSTFRLGNLSDGRFRVVQPFDVGFLLEGDSLVAEAAEINEFGFGSTYSEAIRDLQATIVELYVTLREDQANLGPDIQQVWDTLNGKVRTAHAD